MNGSKISINSMPVTTGIIIDFAKFFELSGSVGAGTACADGKTPILASGAFKGNFVVNLGSGLKFDFAGLIDYNFCSEDSYGPVGSDIGKGLGFGLAAAFETNSLYVGASGEYSINKTKDDTLKYGAVLSVKPARNLRASAWTAMTNNKVLEGGIEFIAMPGSGAFCFDAKTSVLTDITSKDKNMFINAKFGLSYLF